MPDTKLSALTAVVTPVSTDQFYVNQGGISKMETRAQLHTLESGEHFILPSVNEAATPTIAFGDGDSGFYEEVDDNLAMAIGGSKKFNFFVVGSRNIFNSTSNLELQSAGGIGLIVRAGGLVTSNFAAGIIASTTQTQGQGSLNRNVNEVATVANTNDTVTLPSAVAGLRITIINNGANTLQIFPASGDDAGAGVDTAITLAAGSNIEKLTYDATTWEAV